MTFVYHPAIKRPAIEPTAIEQPRGLAAADCERQPQRDAHQRHLEARRRQKQDMKTCDRVVRLGQRFPNCHQCGAGLPVWGPPTNRPHIIETAAGQRLVCQACHDALFAGDDAGYDRSQWDDAGGVTG